MERNMELVLRILRGVNTSKGDLGAGFTYVVAPEHERIIKQPNVVLLPADVCPDAETLYYHFAIMDLETSHEPLFSETRNWKTAMSGLSRGAHLTRRVWSPLF